MLTTMRKKSGAVIAEFAAVIPVFLLLIMGLLEFGWFLHVKQSMSIAAREGVRILATHAGDEVDAETVASDYLASASVDNASVTATDAVAGDSVTLSITVPWADNTLVSGAFGLLAGVEDVEVTMTMRKEYAPSP